MRTKTLLKVLKTNLSQVFLGRGHLPSPIGILLVNEAVTTPTLQSQVSMRPSATTASLHSERRLEYAAALNGA